MITGMDLCKYMMQGKRTEQENLKVMRKLFEGIEYMHSIGIVHRDIKLENIMIHQPTPEDPPIPKFIDFGLSTVLLAGESSSELYGTLAYCSPEIFLGLPYNQPTDIWSAGIVMHMFLSGIVPFMSMNKDDMKRNIIYRKVNFNQPGWLKISNDAKDLVSRMLEKD